MTVLRSGSASDTGLVRSSNQDLVLATSSLFAVADGMGGHAGGEVASRLAIDTLQAAFGRSPTGVGLARAVTAANAAVWEHGLSHAELRGMGTTVTAAALVNEGGHDVLALVNVGDSRSYRFHDGELAQITSDHSLAEEMVRKGELTPAEAAVHPHRHILTRALGVSEDVDVDLWRILPIRGDRFLLCSDGLTNELGHNQLVEVLSAVPDPQEAADLLVRAARSHGGSDNITVIVLDVIIGEEESGSVPAVAAVSSDFALPPVAQAGGMAGEELLPPGPGPVTGTRMQARRERQRARRRQARRARGRRLVTVRTFLFVLLLAAVLAGVFSAVRWLDGHSFYVGLKGNELVIYQGRVGGLLWYQPVEVERTGVTTADVSVAYLPDLRNGVAETSLSNARNYVRNLVAAKGSVSSTVAPISPSSSSTTSPTGTSAATVAGAR